MAHADCIRPVDPKSSDGHEYCLTIVDSCTRWPTVNLLKSITATKICDCFIDLFQYTGIYQIIIMDNGPCFAAKVTQEILKRSKVVPRMLTPREMAWLKDLMALSTKCFTLLCEILADSGIK